MIIGYTSGVFDLFHIGHLNILQNAKALCDRLVVGVTTDELLRVYKDTQAVIPYTERAAIVRAISFVDAVVPQESMDKFELWKKLRFDIMVVGDDWYQTPKWESYQQQFDEVGVRIVYFPYTKGTSSTLINQILQQKRAELGSSNES